MDWIPSLLKQLSVSRSAVVAVFITAGFLYVAPMAAPEHFDFVPAPWSFFVQAALVFSGCLVLFWAWSMTMRSMSKIIGKVLQAYRSRNLDDNEVGLLLAMGERPSDPLNIKRINFQSPNFPLTELELLQVLDGLALKGLVSRNKLASDLFSLTNRGRKMALDITRSAMEKE